MQFHFWQHACLLTISAAAFGASKPDPTITSPPVTVLVDFEHPHSDVSLNAMRVGLNTLLAPAGIVTNIELKTEMAPNAQFAELVVFKMKGHCSMDADPLPVGAVLDERGPLGMAYASDGEILHFGEVECDRLRSSLARLLGSTSTAKSQNALGRAMAMVVAHEIYHMLGNAKQHTHKGVTKTSLSAADLTDGMLKLPSEALEALDKVRPAGVAPPVGLDTTVP